MALPATGEAISMSDINVELFKPSTALISLDDADVRALLDEPTGQISMSDAHGQIYGTITPRANNVNEGDTLIFDIVSTGTYTGYIEFSTGSPIFGESNSSNTVSIVNGVGTYSFVPTPDALTEGAESYALMLRLNTSSGQIIAVSPSFTINDTSTTPVAEMSLSKTSVVTGEFFDINISNAGSGSELFITVNQSDVDRSSLFVPQDGLDNSGISFKHIATLIADSSGNATFRVYTINGRFSFTAFSALIELRVGSRIGTILTTSSITINDGSNTQSADLKTMASNSSTSTAGTAVLSANLLDNDLYIYHDYSTGAVTRTAVPSGWSSTTTGGTTSTRMTRMLYKKMTQAEASTTVSMLDGSLDRKLGIYFRSDNNRLSSATIALIAERHLTSFAGLMSLTLPNNEGILLGSNQIGIFMHGVYGSGNSTYTIETYPREDSSWTNTGSAFQKADNIIFLPNTKIPWRIYAQTFTASGTHIGRSSILLVITW